MMRGSDRPIVASGRGTQSLLGNQVEVAASGHEALETIGRSPLDLLVPLARRTVFCTGDVVTADVHAFLETTGCPVLTKPFDLAQYFDAVARAARC